MRVVLFISIKLNNQRLLEKNLKLLHGIPLCEYLFNTVKEIVDIAKNMFIAAARKIIPYLSEGIEFLKRDPYLDGYQIRGLDLIERFVADVDADIYVLAHIT